MPDYLEEFHNLLDRAEARNYMPDSGGLLEEAARLAQQHNDLPNALLAQYLHTFAVAPMEPEKALVSFSWCLSHSEHADRVLPRGSLAQLYGIAIGILRSYPNYSLEQIEATFERMEALYEKEGLNKRDIWHQRIYEKLSIGDKAGAVTFHEKWKSSEIDAFSCPVCERGTDVLFNLHLERYSRGLAYARPIVEGELACEHGQPLMTLAATLVPLIRTGQFEEALVNYRASRSLLKTLSYAGIWAAGRQLTFCGLLGEIDEGISSLGDYLPTAMRRGTPADRYGYLLAARLFCHRVLDDGTDHEKSQMVELLGREHAGVDSLEHGVEWLESVMMAIAHKFDRRNGNGEYVRIAGVFKTIYTDIRARN